jgi:hypothetical protein
VQQTDPSGRQTKLEGSNANTSLAVKYTNETVLFVKG